MNLNEFRKDYFNNCTERGLYSKTTKNIIKPGVLVPLGCLLLIVLVLFVDQKVTIRFALLVSALIIYPLILLLRLYKEKKKISKNKPSGLGICKFCKWYEMANEEITSILEYNFEKLLSDYKINKNDHQQIDLIVDIINNTPIKEKSTKEKYNRILNLVLSLSLIIIGAIVLMFWESEFHSSHSIVSYIKLTIYGYTLYQLIKYIF